jgi:hypothetical protein
MVRVISQQRAPKLKQLRHPLISQAVAHHTPVTLRIDKPAPAQTRKMVGNLRLSLVDRGDELAHRHLTTFLEQAENPNASCVTEPAEVLRNKIRLGRLLGENKRS